MKTLVQCDFDGTITEEDVSFLLLDKFADGNWRESWEDYVSGRIPVGAFNTRAFAMVKADRKTLLDFILKGRQVKIRPGFEKLIEHCSRHGLKFVIVSNGLGFYIDAILGERGIKDIDVFAAQSRCRPGGMEVKYIGPSGGQMEDGFKEAHTEVFQKEGYGVVYVGNGLSDIYPARRASRVFATGDLLALCREDGLECTPFADFHDVVRGLEAASPG
jgi:2-hydroxy-3-keto-5-methylthiopentenyl-1-phosphate phosphatase